MEEFILELERMRTACQQLPPDFGRSHSVGEKNAAISIIKQVEEGLKKAAYLLPDM